MKRAIASNVVNYLHMNGLMQILQYGFRSLGKEISPYVCVREGICNSKSLKNLTSLMVEDKMKMAARIYCFWEGVNTLWLQIWPVKTKQLLKQFVLPTSKSKPIDEAGNHIQDSMPGFTLRQKDFQEIKRYCMRVSMINKIMERIHMVDRSPV